MIGRSVAVRVARAMICAALVFLALAPASRAGEIYGTVTLNGARVDGGTLVISRHDENRVLVRVTVRNSGDYRIYLAPGHYDARLAGARAPILMRSFPARVRQDLRFSR